MSVKTLRHYHKKQILIPSFVNEDSGYRYYNSRDVERARVISVLKSFQFSLEDIEAILKGTNDDTDIIGELKNKKAQLNEDIRKLRNVTSSIDSVIQKEKEAIQVTSTTTSIEIKVIPEQLVIATRWQGPYSDTGKAMSRIYRAGGRYSAGPAFNLYYDGEHKEIADTESCLPIKKLIKSKLDCRTLPKQRCVSVIHKGSYESLGSSYRSLFDFIKENALGTLLPIREVYIKGPGMIFKGNPDNYVTEILIPIE